MNEFRHFVFQVKNLSVHVKVLAEVHVCKFIYYVCEIILCLVTEFDLKSDPIVKISYPGSKWRDEIKFQFE